MRVSAVIWTPKSRRDKAPRKTRTGTECWKTPNILIAMTTCVEKLTTENLTPAPQLLPIKYSGYSPERKVHKPLPRSSPKSTPRPPPPPARSQRTCIPISSLPSSPPTFTHLLAKNAYFIPLAPGHHPARARRTPTHARRSSCGRCEAWSQMRREKEIQRMSWEIRARLYVCASD